MRSNYNMLLITVMLVWALTPIAAGQLQWRVSVKVIRDANGMRPQDGFDCVANDAICDLNDDAEIQGIIDGANTIMDTYGRGYRFVLSEPIIDLSGVSQWYTQPINGTTRSDLEDAAEADPATYAWRTNAINVYILGTDASGFCSIPDDGDGFGDDDDEAIIMGQSLASPNTPPHEFGHFFNLCHVQGCPCAGCSSGSCATPMTDQVADTLPTQACWNQDAIAMNAFGTNYASSTAAQQQQVDFTFINLMANRVGRLLLTSDQLDKMTDAANGVRNAVASGITHFVDANGSGGTGTSTDPYELLSDGLGAAGSGDIVLVRTGSYPETPTINQTVVLRASRGNAVVGVVP